MGYFNMAADNNCVHLTTRTLHILWNSNELARLYKIERNFNKENESTRQ